MRVGVLVLRRARAQLGTLATLAVLIATVAAILAGAVGYTRAASVATVRATLEDAAPTAAGIQVQTRLADDVGAQDAALARLLPEVDLDVTRTLRTEVASAEVAGGRGADDDAEGGTEAVRVVLGELPAADAIVVTGDRPAPDEVLVPAQTAVEAGLEPGTQLTLRGTVLTVAGTWAPADAEDRDWFADPMVTAGRDASTYGPLLTDAATITGVDPAPFVRWTIYPRVGALTVADLPMLAGALDQLDYALGNDDELAVRGLTVEGSLAQTVSDLELATSTAAAVGLVPVALLAIISLIALVQVVRLLGHTRSREIEILVARGASPRQVTRWGGLELAAVTVAAAAVGTLLAAVAVGRLDGGAAQREVIVVTGVVVAVVGLVTGTLVTALQARSVARRMAADRSGRLQGAAATGTVLLTAAAAVLSAWQLVRHGTVVADGGTTQADVLAVVSLGAVLAALAVLALALLGPAARALAGLRARSRGLLGVLAARQVSRRVRAYAVPLVLVVLAAATGTVAASFAGATFTQRDHVAALSTGTDVRVRVPTGATSRLAGPQAVSAAPYAELGGVTAAGSVLRGGATFGDLPVALTAMDTARVEDVMRVPEQVDLTVAGGLRTWEAPGAVVPAGTEQLELTVRARAGFTDAVLAGRQESAAREVEMLVEQGLSEDEAREMAEARDARTYGRESDLRTTVWLVDADGAPSMLDGGVLTARLDAQVAEVGPEMTEHTVTMAMPGPGAYRVVAVDVDYGRPGLDSQLSYEIAALEADGASLSLGESPWAQIREPESVELESLGVIGTDGAVLPDWETAADLSLRFMAQVPPDAVPVVVSAPLAGDADLAGDWAATLNHRGVDIAAVGEDVVAAVPGGLEEHAVLVDLQTLTGHLLGVQDTVLLPGEVWIATEDGDDRARVAADASALAGPQGEVDVTGRELTDSTASVRETFWIAAAGATLLALTGVAAVALALARERRSEVMVLRALGLPPGGQARSRAAELLGVGVIGAVLGVLAGWMAAVLLVPTLARAAATQTTSLALGAGRLDLLPALGLLAVLAAGLAVVAAVVAARVRSQALDAEYREEVR